ncbi:MAG TPA: plastocyanin/azurin family copper-binding protein [Gemmatimonadales bacterium]|jgi:plastocyanin
MKHSALLAAAALTFGASVLSAQAHPAPGAHPASSTVVRVQMKQKDASHYVFEPANLTIHQGDIVEFVNVSGFPHNVGFTASKIPAGAAEVLNKNMPNKTSSLLGPMMQTMNQSYRVSFAGAPVGTYAYYCLPHQALGMTGVITVQAAGAAPRR